MRCAGQPVRREAVIGRGRVTGGGAMPGVMAGWGSSIPGILGEVLPGVVITTTIIMTAMRGLRIREVMVAGGSEVVIVAAEEMVVAGEVEIDLACQNLFPDDSCLPTVVMEPTSPNLDLPKPQLDVSVSISDGMEEIWVTGDQATVLLCVEVSTGEVRGFSCRATPGMVVEIGCGQTARVGCEIRYPSLCIFMEAEDGRNSPRQYCVRRNGNWTIED